MKTKRQAVQRCIAWALGLAGCLVAVRTPLSAQLVVSVENNQGTAGSEISVCVDMVGSGMVSGIQMNMNWDAQCLQSGTNGAEADCTKGASSGRDTFKTRVLSPGSLKMIMLSISDTTPMPDNVQLFCCNFFASSAINGTKQCQVTLSDIIASDPKGTRLPNIVPKGGTITVTGSGGSDAGGGPGTIGGPQVPQAVNPGQAPAGTGGQAVPAAPAAQVPAAPAAQAPAAPAAGSAPAAAGAAGAAPGLPPVPAVPAMPGVPAIPAVEGAPAAAATVFATVVSTPHPQRTGTAAHSPGPAGTSTPKGTPKPQGTPTHAVKHTGPAGTPTPKAKED